MKNFFYLLLLCGATMISITSCTEDDPNSGHIGPKVSFITEAGFLDSDASVLVGTVVKIKLNAQKGDDQLKAVTVRKDNTILGPGDYKINNAPATSGSVLLFNADKDAFTWAFEFPAINAIDSVTYSFEVEDITGHKQIENIRVVYTGTPVAVKDSVIVFNFSGLNPGGLDLSTLTVTPSADATTDIHDAGIKDPVNDPTWLRQIKIKDGTGNIIHKPGTGFDFNTLVTVDQVKAAFNNGTDFVAGGAITTPLVAGDVLLVLFENTKYAAIKVLAVNEITGSNLDNYVLSIKR